MVKVGEEDGCCSMPCVGDFSFKSLVPTHTENILRPLYDGLERPSLLNEMWLSLARSLKKLRVISKITLGLINKVLLYSIGNYIQYPVINHNGKKYEKDYIYMYVCISESLCYIRN